MCQVSLFMCQVSLHTCQASLHVNVLKGAHTSPTYFFCFKFGMYEVFIVLNRLIISIVVKYEIYNLDKGPKISIRRVYIEPSGESTLKKGGTLNCSGKNIE